MLSRTGLRALQQGLRPARRTIHATARRQAGGPETKLEGVYDNAFNRERLAVKKHAAETSGEKT